MEWDIKGLKQDYLEDVAKGPEVNADLADLFNSMKETGLTKEKVAAKAKEYPMPVNCNLEVKQVNPEIWSNVIGAKERNMIFKFRRVRNLYQKPHTLF